MMDAKTKGRIIQAVRRISLSWSPRIEAKRLCKVDLALYQCQVCPSLIYEGVSQKTYGHYVVKYAPALVIMDRVQLDHTVPVVPITGWEGWDSYFERMFCQRENYKVLCPICHSAKTKEESVARTKLRKK